MAQHYQGTKAQRVEQKLLHQIRIGNFPRGAQLPSEQKLSEQFEVSHMTVRKAIAGLMSAGYLQRKPRIGTFIREEIPGNKLQKQLGIVCPAWSAPRFNDSMMHLSRLFAEEQWICRYVFALHWEDRTIEEIWKSSDALVLFPIRARESVPKELLAAIESKDKPVVYVGNPDVFHTDTVSFDDEGGLRILLEELRQAGHTRIGRISQWVPERKNRPRDERLFLEVASDNTWCRGVDIQVECPLFQSPADAVYRRIREEGADGCTVLLGSYGMILAAWAALTDSGIRVPEEVSLVLLEGCDDQRYLRPRPAGCTFSLKTQSELVRELVMRRIDDHDRPVRNSKVPPCFFRGETLADIGRKPSP